MPEETHCSWQDADTRPPFLWRQVVALEALQLYAPMGHALGLGPLSTSIEDICFQASCSADAPMTETTSTQVQRTVEIKETREVHPEVSCPFQQILFPASYSETAAWLRTTAMSNEGTLQR